MIDRRINAVLNEACAFLRFELQNLPAAVGIEDGDAYLRQVIVETVGRAKCHI